MAVPPNVASLDWCDVSLESVAWEEAGRDVALRVREPSAAGRLRTITCRWTEALDVSLQFPESHGGYALSADGAISELPDGRFSVHLDFASSGTRRLICSEIVVKISE